MNKWIHKHEVKDVLQISELDLMRLVSHGVLKGFDQHYNKVKHYGRCHVDQKEDERLPPNVLSNRVSYFDRGDIINYKREHNLIPQKKYPKRFT